MGFQKPQCYGSESHQQSYAVHEDIWSSKNNHHNHVAQGMHMKNNGPFVDSHEFSKHHDNPHRQAMHMKNNGPFVDSHDFPKHHGMFGGSHGMRREGPYSGHSSFGHSYHGPSGHHGYPSGGPNYPLHGGSGFSSGSKFHGHGPGYGHGHGHFSEETEYESHKEMHNGAGKVKVDEVKYERHNYGGGDGFHASPHNRNMVNKTYVEWGLKGV